MLLRPLTPWAKVKATLRLTVSQSVSLGVESHLGLMTRYLLLFDSYCLVFLGRPLWREDDSLLYMLLVFASAVFLGTRDHILLSQIWDFPFRRLLRLAGPRWRYSWVPRYIAPGRSQIKTRLSTILPLLGIVAETCLPSHFLAMDVSSGATILAFRRHVTISSVLRIRAQIAKSNCSPIAGTSKSWYGTFCQHFRRNFILINKSWFLRHRPNCPSHRRPNNLISRALSQLRMLCQTTRTKLSALKW
jgi:hypothetical protein